jgi:hypothetical protein
MVKMMVATQTKGDQLAVERSMGNGEAGPDDHESAVQKSKAVDVDAELAETPAGGWHRLVLDALEEHAAWWSVSEDFARLD